MAHVLCDHCRLFVKETEERCPFCGTVRVASTPAAEPEALPRASRAVFYAMTMAASTTAFSVDANAQQPAAPPTQVVPSMNISAYGSPAPTNPTMGPMPSFPVDTPAYGVPAPTVVAPRRGVVVNVSVTRGTMDPAPVRAILQARSSQFLRCVESARAVNPVVETLPLVLALQLRANGRPQRVAEQTRDRQIRAAETCAAAIVRQMTFGSGGSAATLSLRILLRP